MIETTAAGNIASTVKPLADREREVQAESGDEQLDRQDFLKLLTTQLQNQNPLDPMENEAFVAQLAQFSQLEATLRSAESVETLVESMNTERMLSSAALVGKKIASESGLAVLKDGGSVEAKVALPDGATTLQVAIKNASGQTVRTLDLGPQSPGAAAINWDGLDEAGEALEDGLYQFEALASLDDQTAKVIVETLVPITAVTLDPTFQQSMLELASGEKISLQAVDRISG